MKVVKPRKEFCTAAASTTRKRKTDVTRYLKHEAGENNQSVIAMKASIMKDGKIFIIASKSM